MEDKGRLIALLTDINEDIDFENEASLVDGGIIDSLEITAIIAAIDNAFQVHIAAGDIEPENFNSVDAMLKLIKRCRQKP